MSSPPTRLECVRELIGVARANKFSTLRKLAASNQDVFDVWDNISQLVEYHMAGKKAVQIPGLGTFTFTSSKLDVGHNKYILIQRPVFVLSEKLARTHRLTQSKYHVPGEIPVIQLNLTALSYDMNVDRDLVEASVKEIVNALSRNIEQTQSAEFGFTTIGNLIINNGAAKMKFLPRFVDQMDQTGNLTKFLSKRPETSNSLQSDQSLVLPKIQPGGNIQDNYQNTRRDIFTVKEEEGEEEENCASPSSSEEKANPEKSPRMSSMAKKEAMVPCLKVEPKSHVAQQVFLSPIPDVKSANPPITPRKLPTVKKAIHFKEPRSAGDSKARKVFPVALNLSTSKLLQELNEKNATANNEQQEENVCSNCATNLTDFCYLCYQKESRNVPVYFTEDRKKEEEEEDRLYQTYALLKDNEGLQREQGLTVKRKEEAQSIARFNLGVSEALKQKKAERLLNFNRSYVFHRRLVTPPHFIRQEDYKSDLAKQVNDQAKKLAKMTMERETLEALEQLQLAEDLAVQRNQYLKTKRQKADEYRKALDTQVYIKKLLEERKYLEDYGDERTFTLPPANVVLPFQKNMRLKSSEGNTMLSRSSELPVAYPDSECQIFGVHDLNDEKKKERRRRAQLLYQNQLKMAHLKKEDQINRDAATKKEEEEMLANTKNELLQETLIRNQINLQQRQDLEKTWAVHAMKKKANEFEEKLLARSPGLLLQEQCDKYKRCVQCTRKPANIGKSNVWAESRYVSGSRLII